MKLNADVNHVYIVRAFGVMCAAVEGPRVESFYIPELGAAPRWCAFPDTFKKEVNGNCDLRESSVVINEAEEREQSGTDNLWSSKCEEEEEDEADHNDDDPEVILM